MTITESIIELNQDHPELPPAEIARQIGTSVQMVCVTKKRFGLTMPSGKNGRPKTVKPKKRPLGEVRDLIIATHIDHPDWCPTQIAKAIGIHPALARVAAQRYGLMLPPGKPGTPGRAPVPKAIELDWSGTRWA